MSSEIVGSLPSCPSINSPNPNPFRQFLSSGDLLAAAVCDSHLDPGFCICPSSATKLPSSCIFASNLSLTASIFSAEGRFDWFSSAACSCMTCSRRDRFSARRREPSVSRLRMRMDWVELVLGSSSLANSSFTYHKLARELTLRVLDSASEISA